MTGERESVTGERESVTGERGVRLGCDRGPGSSVLMSGPRGPMVGP
ncbi:hypothetical protein [Paractinoplanes globisporus]|uniref:Uncharacterized protein n=1 Tax=Paractinoplanes globisporus TaxID=113565 RepID=A0ABW6WA12_9ACTN|nr:hypothetical protein [Actinoplanes globisporus]